MMSAMAGYVLGIVVGGQIAEHWGWRNAYLAVGAPGLALAVITQLVLKEPRHRPEFAIAKSHIEPLGAAIRALFAKPAFVDLLIAIVLYFMMAYGAFVFTVSFLIRVHGATVGTASAIFGTISSVTALVGSYLGGSVADRLAKRDIGWLARLPGWGLILACPIYETAFGLPTLAGAVVMLSFGGIFLTGAIPAMFAALHVVCGSRRRAMSVAVIFFFANLIGTGFGPIVTGRLSDTFARSVGPGDGLRFAMMVVMLTFVPSGYFLLRASKRLARDAEP
jgi:predicted MFS family arabinose efflux permease